MIQMHPVVSRGPLLTQSQWKSIIGLVNNLNYAVFYSIVRQIHHFVRRFFATQDFVIGQVVYAQNFEKSFRTKLFVLFYQIL